jgi:PqqD family protein of HPr-rel-A system
MREDGPVPDLLPRRHADVEIAAFDTSFVVFDPRCMQVHLIDGFGAVVFDACDGNTSREMLTAEVGDATGWDPSTAATEVDAMLAQLVDLGLLEGTTPQDRPP